MREDSTTEPINSPVVFNPQPEEMRPDNAYPTSLSLQEDDYCVFTAKMPAGVVVPLHSQPDRETFHILSGEMNLYDGTSWRILKQGDCVDVLSSTKHAWRNASSFSATMLAETTVRMGVFLQRVSNLANTSRDVQEALAQKEYFFKLVQEYGYWLGSPEDNEAIGLSTNWHRAT
jgi:quercetin dioxygenase-like cupin family protein